MRIFLSYASENRPHAEEIALALQNDGHDVFFDTEQLVGGEHFHQVIRDEIAKADLLVFLISPQSVTSGSYTLTELRNAQVRWPSPRGHVMPVIIESTPMPDIPAYLRAVTLFEPVGNAAAEIATHIKRIGSRRYQRRITLLGAGVLMLAIGIGVALRLVGWMPGPKAFVSSIAASDFVAAFVLPAEAIERKEYSLDPTSRFPTDRGDVLRLERLAFGWIQDSRKAFSVRVSVSNVTGDPITLDLSPRFFRLSDDQGRQAELLYFCCEARGEIIGPTEQRVLQLIYASKPGWEGKESTPGMIHFHVAGLLPVIRATWTFRPLATAE